MVLYLLKYTPTKEHLKRYLIEFIDLVLPSSFKYQHHEKWGKFRGMITMVKFGLNDGLRKQDTSVLCNEMIIIQWYVVQHIQGSWNKLLYILVICIISNIQYLTSMILRIIYTVILFLQSIVITFISNFISGCRQFFASA